MATLRDIAQHCGLSVSTVSMALRDHRSISDDTKRRVWEAQEILGYKMPLRPPSSVIATEQSAATKDIIFLLIDRDFENPTYSQQFQRLAEGAIERHWRPIYLSCPLQKLREGAIPPLLRTGRIDGIVVSGNYDALAHQHLRKLGIPIVIIGRYRLGEDPWMACEPDFGHGVRVFLNRMSAFHHKRFGLYLHTGYGEFSHHLRRHYAIGIEEMGVESVGISSGFGQDKGPTEDNLPIDVLLERGATAILTSGDPTAVYTACAAKGLRIPEDISIVGFSSTSYRMTPSLATVSSAHTLSQLALAKLNTIFQHPDFPLTRELLPMQLLPGGSIGLAPAS